MILVLVIVFMLWSFGLSLIWIYLLSDEFEDSLGIFGVLLIVISVIIAFYQFSTTLNEKDILTGEAIYQEDLHIIDNDTIKTYEIIWKQKN